MLPLPRGAVWQLLFLFCAALYINGVHSDGRVVCYYTNWSVYRPGTAKFNPQNINPYLCTHLIYAFGGFTKDNQMKPFDKYQDIEQGGYAKFTGLKTYNKQLKTMIAIGGWNEASSRFSPLVANPERRQKFIKNILKFLRQNHFDGIDLDWEYPAQREGGKSRDKENYAQFVQELRAEFERESEKTGRPRLLLTMAVPAGIENIEKGYDIPKLNKYLDWFNVLSYDFHSSHEPSVNHHAPLYSLEEESEYNYDAELNIDYSIKFYLNAGADRDKLVLGIPTYGRSYTLINEESTEIGAPAEGPGEQGDATREKGYLAYYEICQNIKEDPEWTVVQPNPNAMGPYAYRRTQWVGYDDEAIVRKKAQYVVDNGLGGIMFWAVDNDDFRGICTGKPYPLIEAAKEAMLDALGFGINEVSKPSSLQKPSRSRSRENSSSTRNRITSTEHKLTYAERKGSSKRTQTTQQSTRNKPQSTTTSAPIKLTDAEGSSLYIGGRTTTPPPPTTPDPGTDFKCEEEGFFQHPRDCKKYYWCLDSGPSGLGIVAHQFTCPSGLYFNPAADSCDFARNVPCKTKKSTTAAPITASAFTTTTTVRPTSSFNRITAATSRSTTLFRTTPRTTTTTTEAYEEDTEYDEEEDSAPSPFAKTKGFEKDSEEDPKVIKELIELIRKVGGIEELEKHLLRKEDGTISIKEHSSSSSSSSTATTPSTISKSLYEKVLSKPNALNSFRNRFISTNSFRTTKTQAKTQHNTEEVGLGESYEGDTKSSGASNSFSKYSSVLRGNSRQGPQNEGIDKLTEFDGFLKEKKQYITINRNRGTQTTTDTEEDKEEEEDVKKTNTDSFKQEEEEYDDVVVRTSRKPFSSVTPSYASIRRTRPSTTTETTNDEAEDIEEKEITERKSYSTLNRNRIRGTTTTESPEVTEVTAGSSRYKYLERTRPTHATTIESINEGDSIDDEDDETRNKENTVHFKAVNIENTRETQQETTTNTLRTYASIGRRSTTTVTPETETTTIAAKTSTTAAISPTTSTTETPITTPLTIIETTTPESILLTTNIPITTSTNPTIISTTTTATKTTKTTTLPNGEDVLDNNLKTTPLPNDISSDVSDSLDLRLNINSILTESSSSSSSTTPTAPFITTESGLDTNEQKINNNSSTTTETTNISSTTASVVHNKKKLTKNTDVEEHEEVNLVSKHRNKTSFNTRTRTTTTKTTTNTTTNSDIKTTSPTTNAKKTLGVRRQQQVLLNRSSQTKKTSTTTTTDTPTPTTESVNNDFLGTVSSPRPFGFPKRRKRPITINVAGTTTNSATSSDTADEVVKANEESLITKQKTTTTKLNAAANSQSKKYQFQRRTTTAKTTTTTRSTTTENPAAANRDEEVDEDYNGADRKGVKTKTQVIFNEGNAKDTSTSITETTAPPTSTESPTSPATPLARRIKVLRFKRPLVSNNTNTTASTITLTDNSISATNLGAKYTAPQNIVQISSVYSDLESQIVQTQALTGTETTDTQTAKPLETSHTPKRFRKVIRILKRPVNRTTEAVSNEDVDQKVTAKEISTETSTILQRTQNATRYGFNRSPKFYKSNTETKVPEEVTEGNGEEEKDEEEEENEKDKFTLPSSVTSTSKLSLHETKNRNQLPNRLQPMATTTTEAAKNGEESVEDESDNDEENDNDEDDEEKDDDEEQEEEEEVNDKLTDNKLTRINIYTNTNRFRHSKPLTETTENPEEEENYSTTIQELETTTTSSFSQGNNQNVQEFSGNRQLNLEKIRNKIKTEQSTQQTDGVLNERLTATNKAISEKTKTDNTLSILRNKVKQDLSKGNNQEEGVLSTRFKSSKTEVTTEQVEDDDTKEKDDPLLKLRNKVKQDLAKGNQVEGVLSDRFNSSKQTTEVDDPLLKLRNKVKQELAKGDQDEGVVSVKLKKLLETKNRTEEIQSNLAETEEGQGVITSRLKTLLSNNTSATVIQTNGGEEEDEESTTELKETSGNTELLETNKFIPSRKPFAPKTELTSAESEEEIEEPSTATTTSTTASTPREKPSYRRKLVAKRPYTPTKPPLSSLRTTTIKTRPTKKKFVRRKFGRFHPFNTSNRNTGEGFVRTDPRGNILPGTDHFKIEGSAGGDNGDYEEYNEEEEEEGNDREVKAEVIKEIKQEHAIKSAVNRTPGLFNRPPSTNLNKPVNMSSKEHLSVEQVKEENEEDQDDDEDEEEDEEDEEEEDEDVENESEPEDKTVKLPSVRPSYKPKNNHIPPAARPTFTTTPTIKKPYTPLRVVNTPYRPDSGSLPISTISDIRGNRFGSSLSRSTTKPRVVNRPLVVSVPNFTIKPVANDFEPTTVLIPTKPAPFINHNTRAYERKYTGPSTESPLDSLNDNNPLIEDLNIEALNARNKKIFDINSKKHTTLKPKVVIPPLVKVNDNTTAQLTNTEYETDDGYQASVNATTTNIISNTTTQLQQNEQSTTTQDNTITTGTQNTEDANLSNPNNLNEISSQAAGYSTTTPPPSTTLLHIFTLPDEEQTTQNPLKDGYKVGPRIINEIVKPKHKVLEINRIVEVNSKEEKRKSKANVIVPVEGSATYRMEILPHVEQLGEISVVKYVHEVDGSDITIDGRSTVTDYTPIGLIVPNRLEPVRYSLPESRMDERYGKALVPEVIREAIETSTISLEGLFDSSRKGKVLNTREDVITATHDIAAHFETSTQKSEKHDTSTESFNILKMIAFDVAKINLEPNGAEEENISTKQTDADTTATTLVSREQQQQSYSSIPVLTTTPVPEINNVESTTVTAEETKATTVAAALFPQYVRPIVPLLRPESHESSPLVISIANLDKVILSKVRKMVNGVEVEEEDEQQPKQQQQEAQQKHQEIINHIIPQIDSFETLNSTNTNILLPNTNNQTSNPVTQTETPEYQDSQVNDSNGAFSSRLASIVKAPLLNALTPQYEKHSESHNSNSDTVSVNSLDKAKQNIQTELYTINEGSVGSTTSSTMDTKISQIVSFSSETTVVRRKQPRKAIHTTTIAPAATELVSQS